jgi:hypothetical protein
MVERLPSIDRRREAPLDGVPAEALVPAPEPARATEREPSREQLVAAAKQRAALPTSVPSVPLKKIATGAGIGVGGLFAGTIVAQLAAMWGIHKVMDKVGDFFAGPIVKGILKLGKLNPFSWVWNKIVGDKGGGPPAAAAHAPDPHHGH